jgi:hypothetical protein
VLVTDHDRLAAAAVDAEDRGDPLVEGEIAHRYAAPTARTIPTHLTLNANMRPQATTAERTSEPGTQDEPQRD